MATAPEHKRKEEKRLNKDAIKRGKEHAETEITAAEVFCPKEKWWHFGGGIGSTIAEHLAGNKLGGKANGENWKRWWDNKGGCIHFKRAHTQRRRNICSNIKATFTGESGLEGDAHSTGRAQSNFCLFCHLLAGCREGAWQGAF